MPERGKSRAERPALTLRQDFFGAPSARAGYAELLQAVFGVAPGLSRMGPTWRPFAYFDERERCVATLELCDLTLALADDRCVAAGIRLVAVAEDWRGRGLFRMLMEQALADCDRREIAPILLFTADDALYRRFGFEPVAQHAFAGAPPTASVAAPARILDLDSADRVLVARILASRAPVSRHVALLDAPALFLDKVEADDDVILAHLPDSDALVVFERADDALVLLDVAAATMPTLAHVLGALPDPYARVVTLFPPDRLHWSTAHPIAEETGLMVRGPLPAAMRQPFMLPPTAEF